LRSGVVSAGPAFVLMVLLASVLGGCAEQPVSETTAAELERMAVAGDWNSIAVTDVNCTSQTETCAKVHATKGDGCLRLAIQQPQSASAQDSRMHELLDCAEQGYRNALARQPSKTAPSRISYHGGLLLTLSERRNRLDNVRVNKQDRENEKLLMAAQDARREVPDSALGFLYGASAHVYRATLKPRGRDRCNDLRQAESLLRRSPPPPEELAAEQERIRALTQRQLHENACPRIIRR